VVTRRTSTVAAITVAVLVAIGVLAAVAIQHSYDSNLAADRSKLTVTAQVTAELISQQMISVEDIERATLQRPGFIAAIGSGGSGDLNTTQLQPILKQIQSLRPEFQFATVADAEGIARATAPPDASVVGNSFSFRDWYLGVLRTGRLYVSTAYVSTYTGAPLVVAVASPIRAQLSAADAGLPTGPVIGVLFIGYKIGSVQAFADRLAALQKIDLQVTDQAGVVVSRTGGISGRLTSASGAPEVAAALAGHSMTTTSASAIAVGVPVAGLGWTVSASTPLAATAAVALTNMAILIAGGLLFLLSIAGVALVLTTRGRERAYILRAASEAQLRTVQQTLTEGIQVFAADGTLVSRNPAAERIYEVSRHERTTEAITPKWELLREDGSILPMDEGPLAVAMRTGETSQGVDVGLRKRADKTVRWLSISTVPIRGPASIVTGYVSCARDNTERMQMMRELGALSRASQQLGASMEPDAVVRAITSAAGELCSAPGEQQRRAQLFVIDGPTMTLTGEFDPDDSSKADGVTLPIAEHPHIQRVIATGEPVIATLDYQEYGPAVADLMRQHGVKNSVWVPLTRNRVVFAVLTVAGRQHALITTPQLERLRTLAAMGELALSNAEAHRVMAGLVRTDPLTGVGNRRALDDRFAHLPRIRFALVAIDVDDLKKVNDAHGHQAGDDLLAKLAAVLAPELRPSDVLARTGGDEFVALLVDCDAPGAIELGKRLQRATRQVRFAWGTASISLGSAAGAAGDAPEEVAKAADEALYAAKRARKARAMSRPAVVALS
jgi:diguanylate cyclase (GGDEF)-like protein/PAS domain S-box-containing protein